MKRTLLVIVPTLVVAGCVPTAPAPPPGKPAYIYGDSMIIQAEPYLKPGFTQRALIGASPCGYYHSGQWSADAATKPSVVILIFIGLYDGYWCEEDKGSPYQAYLYDFRIAKSIFKDAKVYAVMPPANQSPAFDNHYVADAAAAAQSSGVLLLDARTPLNGYARESDGVHLQTPGNQKLAEILSKYYKGGSR